MDGYSRKPVTQGLLYLAALGASFSVPFTAQAAAINTYECSLASSGVASGLSTCASGGAGGGYLTSVNRITGFVSSDPVKDCHAGTGKYCGVQAKGTAVAPVYAWNVCRWIDQTSGAADGFFVPFGTQNEWTQFRSFVPSGLTVTGCAVPAALSGLPATTNIMSYSAFTLNANYESCNDYNYNTPQVYGRPTVSLWPSSPATIGSVGGSTLTCNNGNTTMMAKVQWRASATPATDPPTPGDWTWERDFFYSPDVDLTASVSGSQVTLNWVINPYVTGAALSGCTVTSSPNVGAWGPSAIGMPRTGSTVLNLGWGTAYSFSLRCNETPGGTSLTSIASTAVTTGWGGGCSEGCGWGWG